MPEYLHPGVYIEEIERGPKPIEGVPTSTAAFLGETERGSLTPTLVTSFKDYARLFGGVYDPNKFMPYAVNGFFENGGKRLYVARVVDNAAKSAQIGLGAFVAEATGPGTWGNRVYLMIEDSKTTRPVAGGNPVPVGFRLRVAYYAATPAQSPEEWFKDPTKGPRPAFSETFEDLALDESSPDYFDKRLKDSSSLIKLARAAGSAPGSAPDKGFKQLAGGLDGEALDPADFVGSPEIRQAPIQGLRALELDPFREVALVYSPAASPDVAKAIITHCENLRYRFAVIDCDKTMSTSFEPRNGVQDTKYAAFYYPWIRISDPQTGARKEVPPGGHVLGIYARTDSERGVFKAPANEIVRGALELTVDTDDGTQDVFNPRGINAIRQFPGRGIRVWGARTLSSDALWKYVNVRRLFIFLERSIYEGTQWVVFEPNDDRLWARVVDTIRLFLRGQWRLGALLGRTEQEAFFITCDRTTMTQDDILNGRLICEIGIAPVRPAEFVIFRIFQHTAEAQR
jgi:Bacteriophage tail sheath protein